MFPERLKKLRKEKKITQEELGKKVNVTKVSISGYENGNRTPDTETLQKLADFFDVSVDYLLGRTDDPSPRSKAKDAYDPLAEINKKLDELGIENIFFYDMEAWKNFTPEDVEELKRHFEWVAHKARERKKE